MSIKHIIYDKKFGNISSITKYQYAPKLLPPLANEDMYSEILLKIDSDISNMTHYIKDGKCIEYNDIEKVNKYEACVPFIPFIEWDNSIMSKVDTRELEQIRLATWDRLKQESNILDNKNIILYGKEFQADTKSKEAIFKQYQLSIGKPEFVVNWVLADNSIFVLDYTAIKELVNLINDRTQKIMFKLQGMRNTVFSSNKEVLAQLSLEI